jgi:AraC family transcriptional regulator, arabinose operon regulatory protein
MVAVSAMDGDGKSLYLWRMATLTTPPRFYRCEPGWSWGLLTLKDYDLWYVLDGAGTVQLDGVEYPVGAHCCFVFAPGAQIKAQQDPHRRLRVFAVHFESRDGPAAVRGVRVRDAAFFGALARRCEASYRAGSPVARRQSAALVEQMVLHLCAEAEEPAATVVDSRIGAMVELIQEEPGRRWLVTELARRARLSRSQFTRRFAAATGLAPEMFVIQARVERARQLLRETDMTVSQIADALGYRDVYYFSRQFARVAGKTATSCRNEIFSAKIRQGRSDRDS